MKALRVISTGEWVSYNTHLGLLEISSCPQIWGNEVTLEYFEEMDEDIFKEDFEKSDLELIEVSVVPLTKGKTVEENELLETIVVNLNKNNNGWSISKEQIIRMLKIMTSSNITNIIEPMISKEKVV